MNTTNPNRSDPGRIEHQSFKNQPAISLTRAAMFALALGACGGNASEDGRNTENTGGATTHETGGNGGVDASGGVGTGGTLETGGAGGTGGSAEIGGTGGLAETGGVAGISGSSGTPNTQGGNAGEETGGTGGELTGGTGGNINTGGQGGVPCVDNPDNDPVRFEITGDGAKTICIKPANADKECVTVQDGTLVADWSDRNFQQPSQFGIVLEDLSTINVSNRSGAAQSLNLTSDVDEGELRNIAVEEGVDPWAEHDDAYTSMLLHHGSCEQGVESDPVECENTEPTSTTRDQVYSNLVNSSTFEVTYLGNPPSTQVFYGHSEIECE
jgi:hypothetical protein